MDEIEYKLNTNNSVLIVNAIDKLITTIKSKYKPGERQKFVLENEELKFLREKCSSKEHLVSLTACQGLLALVELGVLEIGHTMSTVVTLLSSASNYSAIISTMAGLLTLDLKSRLVPGQPYTCPFTLRSPLHPLVTALEKCPQAESDVLAQLHALCNHHDYIISSNSLELLRPVFTWLTCDPRASASNKVWQLLLSLPQSDAQEQLLLTCLSCQQTNSPKSVERAYTAYSTVTEWAIYNKRVDYVVALLPLLARVAHDMARHGRDPRACYTLMDKCFQTFGVELQSVAGIVVSLLADNNCTDSRLYLHQCNLCLNIITKYEIPSIPLNTFAALSLQWLNLPSYLTKDALKIASKIIEIYLNDYKDSTRLHTPNLKANKKFEYLLNTDKHLSIIFKLHQTWERIKDDEDKLKSWLDNIEAVDSKLQLDLAPFLIGIMMEKQKDVRFEQFAIRALNILIRLVDVNKDVSVQLLPILLFKIANDKSPKMKMECLKALPLMAKTKENVPIIVSILHKLKTNKGVAASTLIMLYTSLAETQVRCFPYLQEMLLDGAYSRPDDLKWETDIARAMAVKRICQIRPTSHGLELVSIISSLLNKCTDRAGAVVAKTALEALTELWKASAVAPAGAWRALEAKLGRDNRPTVQISICNLLGEVPALRVQTPEYDKLISDTARTLWNYIATSNQPQVIYAACEALGGYKTEDYKLKDVPEIYRKTVKLPPSYCKTPAYAARNPEDVLDYIPCEIWPEVYRYTNQAALHGVERLVYRLIEREVRGYRSGVYQPDARAEPTSMSYLPPSSVVRGVMDCFRKQSTSPSYDYPDPILLSILNTLTLEYPKPLPPLDLCFLHEVYHRGCIWRASCVRLAARQAQTSGSARRFVDNYLQGVVSDSQETDVDLVFELLPILCRGMPPNSLRPILDKCLGASFETIANVKTKQTFHLEEIIKEFRTQKDSNPKHQKDLTQKDSKHQNDLTQRDSNTKLHKKDFAEQKNIEKGCKNMEVFSEKYKFIKQLQCIRECLESDKIHDANRTLLSQFVEGYFNLIKDDNVAFPAYIHTCSLLPTDYVERITSPSSWWEVTSQALRSACAVRSIKALDGLVWLNEIIDACANSLTEQEFSLHCMVPALKAAHIDAQNTKEWFLQLMARTQVAFKETEEQSSKLYLCDVFMLAVIVLSGHWAFDTDVVTSRSIRHLALPPAVAALVDRDGFTPATQMLEWLIHTRDRCNNLSLSLACHLALLAARQDNLWRRIENVKHFGKNTTGFDD